MEKGSTQRSKSVMTQILTRMQLSRQSVGSSVPNRKAMTAIRR